MIRTYIKYEFGLFFKLLFYFYIGPLMLLQVVLFDHQLSVLQFDISHLVDLNTFSSFLLTPVSLVVLFLIRFHFVHTINVDI